MFQRPHNTKIEHKNEQNHPAQRSRESPNYRKQLAQRKARKQDLWIDKLGKHLMAFKS